MIEKRVHEDRRQRTEYQLTQAGVDLQPVIGALLTWGTMYVFDEPRVGDLDPVLLLWWIRGRGRTENLLTKRVVVQFDSWQPLPLTGTIRR